MLAPHRLALIALATALLPGCIVSSATKLVTAPIRVGSKGLDMMTTSQSESDEKRGRDLRHREERLGLLEREYNGHTKQCMRGNAEACDQARMDYGEIQNLRATVPAPPR